MPKPRVICHMASSVDGRVKIKRWSPMAGSVEKAYEEIHDKLAGDAWICGRVTMNGYAEGDLPARYVGPTLAREDFIATNNAGGYAIGLDAHGKMNWGKRNDIAGDHIVVVLSEAVGDAHLAALRQAGVSYFFGGRDEIDIPYVLEKLNALFGIQRLLLEGGGRINGSFLRAGVVDELSLLLAPAVDGLMGAPAVFDYPGDGDNLTPKSLRLTLLSHEVLADGVVWLRYAVGTSA